MNQLRESQRIFIGAIIGALFGLIFGAITALGAAHGDRTIKSGLQAPLVFLLSFVGWLVCALIITKLWKYAHDERSANWIGMISVAPLVATSLAVASPVSAFLSIGELFAFVIGDVIGGIIVGEVAWTHFGKKPSESADITDDKRG
jgi:uncharacterized membrane protein